MDDLAERWCRAFRLVLDGGTRTSLFDFEREIRALVDVLLVRPALVPLVRRKLGVLLDVDEVAAELMVTITDGGRLG